MVSSYQEAVAYLYRQLPMFQRVGAAALKKDLTNTYRLCEVAGNPHHRVRFVHVAGTNGKGSSSHLIASILQEAGYKAGLYTSPHLKSFTERIRINGLEVEQDFVVDFVNRYQAAIERIQPSFFEVTVVMAFEYFALQQVDIAVIEVGLGGRLDSTNVITPLACLITNIGYDHMDLLGDTLEAIAHEKAGIIKPAVPVVVSEYQEEVASVFTQRASEMRSDIEFASRHYTSSVDEQGVIQLYRDGVEYLRVPEIPLKGNYQLRNLPGVVALIRTLERQGIQVSDHQLAAGIAQVVSNTGLKGRWQILNRQPLAICDTGHNVDGLTQTMQQLQSLPHDTLRLVFGLTREKDVDNILRLLPVHAVYYFCQARIPRAMDASYLCERATRAGLHGMVVADVNAAYRLALSQASAGDVIFIGGSTFVVAELDEL